MKNPGGLRKGRCGWGTEAIRNMPGKPDAKGEKKANIMSKGNETGGRCVSSAAQKLTREKFNLGKVKGATFFILTGG